MNQTTDYKCYHVHIGHGKSYIHITFNYIATVNIAIATSLILRKNKAVGKHPK